MMACFLVVSGTDGTSNVVLILNVLRLCSVGSIIKNYMGNTTDKNMHTLYIS